MSDIPDEIFLEAGRREELCADKLIEIIKEKSPQEGSDDQVFTESRCNKDDNGDWSIWARATAVASLFFLGIEKDAIDCCMTAELPPENLDFDVVVKTSFLDEVIRMTQLAEKYWPGSILKHVFSSYSESDGQ